MPMQCCAFDCKNRARKGCGKQFFRFPSSRSDKKRRKKWILATQREGWEPTVNSRICSDHFISGKPSERCNDPDYVPTIFNLKRSDPAQSSLFVFFGQFTGNKETDETSDSNHRTRDQQIVDLTDDDTGRSSHLPVLTDQCDLNVLKSKSTPGETTSPYFSSSKMRKSLKGIFSRCDKSSTEALMDQRKRQLRATSRMQTT